MSGRRPATAAPPHVQRRTAGVINGLPANKHAYRTDGHEIPSNSGLADAVQPGEVVTASADIYNDDGDFTTDAVHQVKVTWEVLQCDGSVKVFDFNQVVDAHSWPYGGPTPRVSADFTIPNTCPDSDGLTRTTLNVVATEVSTGGAGEDGWIMLSLPVVPMEQTHGCVCAPGSAGKPRLQNFRGDPVNTATGAYSESTTDAVLGGVGVPLTVQRTYSSNDTNSTPLGPGWTMPWFASLTVTGNGDIVFRAEDGNRYPYTKNSDGTFRGPLVSRSSLKQSGSTYVVTTPDRHTLTFDSAGHLTGFKDRAGHGLSLAYTSGQVSTVTDAVGHTVSLTYTSGLLTKVTLQNGSHVDYGYTGGRLTTATTPARGTTMYTYDAGGRLDSAKDANGNFTVRNTYNTVGQVTSQQDPTGATTAFAYNGAETDVTAPDGGVWTDVYTGNVLTATYDPLGNKIMFHFDGAWNLTYARSPLGNAWTMTYDAAGDLLSRTAPAPLSYTERWTYDQNGNVSSHTDGRGKVTKFAYNGAGEVTSLTTPAGGVTTLTYDSGGRLTKVVDPRGNATGADPNAYTWTYGYDGHGQPTTVTDPLGHVISATYDDDGNTATVTDGEGDVTEYGYDAADRINTVTAADGGVTTYEYDAVGNLTKRTDAAGHATAYAYDAADRVTTVTDPLGRTSRYGYNAAGDPTTFTNARGTKRTVTVDTRGLPTAVSYSDGTPGTTYGYDAAARVSTVTDATGSRTLTYDNADRLVGITAGGKSYAYAYDQADNITSRTYPDSDKTTYTYDADENMATETAGGATVTYGYDTADRLTGVTLPSGNGYTETRGYDAAGRLAKVASTKGSTTLSSWTLTLDKAGRTTQLAVARAGIATPPRYYGYDPAGRILSECVSATGTTGCPSGSAKTTYTYDKVGNRLTKDTGAATTTYTYDPADELTKSVTGTASVTYGYDLDGNQTSAGATTSAYDANNRQTKFVSGSTTYTYGYDASGNRYAVYKNGGLSRTIGWDLNNALPQPAYEGDSTGATSRDHHYDPQGAPQSMKTSAGTFFDHHDWLGGVTDLTNASGVNQNRYSYDAFGNTTTTSLTSNAPLNPLNFAGQYNESTNGLYDLRARNYDPATGRLTSRDPVVNRQPYVYADDDPVDRTDPSGLFTIGPCIGGAIGAIGGGTGQLCPLIISWDDRNGDLAIGGTLTGGGGLQTPTIGLSGTLQLSTARTISQLGKGFWYAGGSIGAGPTANASAFWGDNCDAPGGVVTGIDLGIGLKGEPGFEAHAGESYTWTATYLRFNTRSLRRVAYVLFGF